MGARLSAVNATAEAVLRGRASAADAAPGAAMLPAMAGRSPARFLAPLALIAFTVALLMVISSGNGSQGGEEPASNAQPAATATPAATAERKR